MQAELIFTPTVINDLKDKPDNTTEVIIDNKRIKIFSSINTTSDSNETCENTHSS
jgi:hypothetical protein